jgi:hypothetical protein
LPEVREFITRHTASNKHDTGWAKGAPSEDHTTPPSSRTASGGLAAAGLLGGRPQAPARFRGGSSPGSHTLVWSHIGSRRLSLRPAPVRVTCARISSNRAAVCACIRRLEGVAPRGARSSSCPGYLWLNALSRLLFSSISSVWPGVAPPAPALPSSSRPLLRSGRGLGLCRLFPLLAAGLAAPSLFRVSLWRLLRRSSAGGFLLWCARAFGRGV